MDARTDEQRMLADSVEGFNRRSNDLTRVRQWRAQYPGFDRALWKDMAGLGWTGLLVAQEHGGSGLNLEDMAVVAQGLASQLLPEPLAACAVLGVRTLAHCDDQTMTHELLADVATGTRLLCVAFQEQAGELLAEQLQTRAGVTADSVTLNGTKRFVAGAAGADGYLVSANSGAGTVLVYVPANTAGVSVDDQVLADGRYSATLTFADVVVPAGNLLVRENQAPTALAQAIDETTAIACAEMVGMMQTVLDMTLEYLRTRVQFGKPIGSFQSLQHRCVDLFVQQQLAQASLADALQALRDAPGETSTAATVSRAKARCSDAAALLTRQAIQLHGAIGYTEDSDVGLFVKRALTLGAWLGNSAWHRRRFFAPCTTRRRVGENHARASN